MKLCFSRMFFLRVLCMITAVLIIMPLSSYAEETQTYALGSKGAEVQEINRRLYELRYLKKGSVRKLYTEKTADAVRAFQRENGLPETGEVDAEVYRLLFSDAAAAAPWPTMPPLSTGEPPEEPELPETDADGYLKEEGEFFYENEMDGRWYYLSGNLQIYIRKYRDRSIPLEWFETEILARNGERFHTVMTNPDRPGSGFRYPFDIARDAGFVLGFSDDFYADRVSEKQTVGNIIREGDILFSETHKKRGHSLPNLDMMAQYPDGRLEVYECNEYTAQDLLDRGALNVFSFGPILIRDGEINEQVYTYYRSTEPRQALGMIEPNHYLLVSVLGRTSDSKGTMLQRVAEIMKGKGVTQALNLDGGNTLALVFRGKILHRKATFKKRTYYRTVTSLIGIGYTDDWE